MAKKIRNFQVQNLPEAAEEIPVGKLSIFDRGSPDIGFLNGIDQEIIQLGGSLFHYYPILDSDAFDDVYEETRDRLVGSPLEVWGQYDAKVVEQNLAQFGIEYLNDQTITFNKSYIEEKVGRVPKAGDILKSLFQNIFFDIFEVQEDSFEIYGVYHLILSARILRDTSEVQIAIIESDERGEYS